MRPERYVEAGLKGVTAKKMDANQGNFEAAVKSDSAKITSRKLTCSTVENPRPGTVRSRFLANL